jgi:hypothetical protein
MRRLLVAVLLAGSVLSFRGPMPPAAVPVFIADPTADVSSITPQSPSLPASNTPSK